MAESNVDTISLNKLSQRLTKHTEQQPQQKKTVDKKSNNNNKNFHTTRFPSITEYFF